MLEIKNVTKTYKTGGFTQKALDNVSVSFRECEFTSILGPSGSGKTTFLNIIGGLDHYDSGDLIINGISTKKYKDSNWDSYRNHRIGFVFQNYNLISHQTVLSNVRLALTLSGISKKDAIEKAKKALKDVGLENHMHKRPNQLSGGQMQRVAIARALVNNPDILLADEPTGALDSETSVQIMELLKKISKEKLVIMVTHNPDLANKYSNRIINLKDGKITSDSNPYNEKKEKEKNANKTKKTSMSFLTALSLSFNNLMTKKARTILVAFAGSIGIIGIALILAVSTGFQNYVDSIQEDTLSSYPLAIMQESTDITGALLAMQSGNGETSEGDVVKEQQYMTSMFANIKLNDIKSFKKYLEDNYSKVDKDLRNVKYSYSIEPLIYTIDATNKLAKLNPSNLFSSMFNSNMMGTLSSMTSIYSQTLDSREILDEQYEVLAGKWPEKYNEMIIVLSEKGSISDLLVYSLGLRDYDELTEMFTKIMSGESADIHNEPMTFTYDDLLNVKLKMINPYDIYKYNHKYDVYEDMSEDSEYMKNLYDNALELKIVGVVTTKSGVTSSALTPGVHYQNELIDYIIDNASKNDIVKKQLDNPEVDVFSNTRFDSKQNNLDLQFSDLVNIDKKKLSSAFNIKFDQKALENQTKDYMGEISNSITTDINPAKKDFTNGLTNLKNGLFNSISGSVSLNDVDSVVNNYLNSNEAKNIMSNLEKNYVIPASTFKTTYVGLLKTLLQIYISTYAGIDSSLTTDPSNPTTIIDNTILDPVYKSYSESAAIVGTIEKLAQAMTETKMKVAIMTKVGELTGNLSKSFANSFNVDQNKIAKAFTLKFSEDELMRIFGAMANRSETNQSTNLIKLGYQDKDIPTYISFYFTSFDGKEHFLKFLDDYNELMEKEGNDDKVIHYSDTTGILMDSVKTIVNAVSYVLIAFVSISLVVSSIMIGVITYISVYERTKEIGILRSIGASKHNISSIFNAETFIIGLLSGIIGIGITYTLIPIINTILHHYTGNIPLSAALEIKNALVLVVLSIILTLIGGLIPARKASKKDPVEALRSE